MTFKWAEAVFELGYYLDLLFDVSLTGGNVAGIVSIHYNVFHISVNVIVGQYSVSQLVLLHDSDLTERDNLSQY